MSDTTARIGVAVVGSAIAGTSGMPDFSGDHFTWEGRCWEAVTDPDLLVATMDPSAPAAAKEALVVRQVQTMDLATKKLIVTDEAILNHATLIGQTVVDDINVQGKLIGRDGVFTGTVDFENVNVTGTQIVNKLGANSISADKISGGSFSGQTFEGGRFIGSVVTGTTVVGGLIKTRDVPTQGGLAIDSSTGLRAWNRSGEQTVSIDPVNGDLRMGAGVYLTGSDRNGLVLNPPSKIGTASIYFSKGESLGAADAAIWRPGYTNRPEHLRIRGANGEGIYVQGGLSEFQNSVNVGADLSVGGVSFLGETYMYGYLRFPSPPGTSMQANVYMNPTNGVIARSSSSRRYKKNIKDWKPDPGAVLQMRPRTWQAKDPMIGESPSDWFVGMVAEEVHDLGLLDLVSYDEYGAPEAIHYPVVAVAQQAVLQKHEAEITELRERIALLEQNQEPQ